MSLFSRQPIETYRSRGVADGSMSLVNGRFTDPCRRSQEPRVNPQVRYTARYRPLHGSCRQQSATTDESRASQVQATGPNTRLHVDLERPAPLGTRLEGLLTVQAVPLLHQPRFTPAALAGQSAGAGLRTVFCAEGDWRRAEVEVTQAGATARLTVSGDGDLEAATMQACRFLALDIDARAWPEVGRRDPVIGGAQAQLPGLRTCGFHSPYEAAAWAVLAQRLRIAQAARLRADSWPATARMRVPRAAHPAPARLGSSRP